MLTKSNLPITRYKTIEAANKTALSNAASDPEWRYEVEAHGTWFVVVCYDEDSLRVGVI
jgi:hypothetical protein